MQQYGVTNPHNYEYDHLIPLELGGAPDNPLNLWPEPHSSSYTKDGKENELRSAVCRGAMTLRQAQALMRTDWRR